MQHGWFNRFAIELRPVANFSGHMLGTVASEAAMVQGAGGSRDLDSLRVTGRDVQIVCLRTQSEISGYVALPPDWTAVPSPLSWQDSCRVNGREIAPGDFFVTRGNGYAGRGFFREQLIVMVRTSRLCATIAALSGRPEDHVSLPELHLHAVSHWGARYRRDMLAFLRCLPGNGADFGRLSPEVESDVNLSLANALLPALGKTTDHRERRSAHDIVLRALTETDLDAGMPTVSSLCRAAAVGRTRLFQSFASVYEVSPWVVLQQLRLARARERLMDRDAPPRSVKDVQFGLGYSNGGRFAGEYRALFGESPNQKMIRHGQRRS